MPQIQFTGDEGDLRPGGEGEHMVRGLQATREGVDEKLQRSQIRLFTVRRRPMHLSGNYSANQLQCLHGYHCRASQHGLWIGEHSAEGLKRVGAIFVLRT